MNFKYKAVGADGKVYEDFRDAPDKNILNKELSEKGITLLSATEAGGKGSSKLLEKIKSIGTISTKEKIIFGRNLGSMIESGLALSRALHVIKKQSRNKTFQKVLDSIISKVNKGNSLNSALASHPKIFSPLFIAMVKSGEESGKLSESLKVVADQTEKTYLLRKRIVGALIYPSVIISVMIIIGISMMVFVVPTLTETFTELDVDLPVTTQFIIDTSAFFKDNLMLLGLAVLVLIGGLVFAFRTTGGQRVIQKILLKMPLISSIVKESNSARTTRTLASLITAGVSYVESIRITESVIQNLYYKDILEEAMKKVELGEPISGVLSEHEDLYPPLVGEMVAVGEETGQIGKMLVEVAVFYENEVEQKTKNLSTVVEPFLMVIVGIAVGFFAVSMISPMYSLVDSI